jgi:hypothetical protein
MISDMDRSLLEQHRVRVERFIIHVGQSVAQQEERIATLDRLGTNTANSRNLRARFLDLLEVARAERARVGRDLRR